MTTSVKKDPSKSIFHRLGEYETFRIFRRGNIGNLISILLAIGFFVLCYWLQNFYPKFIDPEKQGLFFAISLYSVHEFSFIFCNLAMLFVYKSRLFEKYKTYTENWPWDENYDKWIAFMKDTFKCLLINQGLVLPMTLLPYLLRNDCIYEYSYEKLPDIFTMVLHIIFLIICEDFSFYWSHRILHHKKLYAVIHKIHHRYRLVVSIASEYAHPLEYLVANVLASNVGSLILGKRLHIFTSFVWIFFRVAETTDGHSGYEFPWSPFRLIIFGAGQEYHNYHHLNFDGNYGSFTTIWDRLFQTSNNAFLDFIEEKYEETDGAKKFIEDFKEKIETNNGDIIDRSSNKNVRKIKTKDDKTKVE